MPETYIDQTQSSAPTLPTIPNETLLPHTVCFLGTDCLVLVTHYQHGGSVCLELLVADDGESMTVATVNVPGAALADGEVIIKDYSENEGVMDALIAAGVIEDTGKLLPGRGAGFRIGRISSSCYGSPKTDSEWAIEPAEKWPFEQLTQDYRSGHNIWREVSEENYDDALNVMPPHYLSCGFMLGEPCSHEGDGAVVAAAFVSLRGRFFARLTTTQRFERDDLPALKHMLATTPHAAGGA